MPASTATPADWARLLRPHHGLKNAFVLAAPFFGGRLDELAVWPGIALAVICFGLLSSATYAMNDAADFEADRLHPRKRLRPIAAGRIAPRQAVIVAAILALLGLMLAILLGPPALLQVLGAYLLINLLYSGGLKEWPVLDLFLVASGFVLRILAGGAATATAVSPWLILCTTLATLFLVAAKRRSERAHDDPNRPGLFHHRPVLGVYPRWLLELMCWGSGIAAAVAYAAYAWLEQGWLVAAFTAPLAALGLIRYGLLTRPGSERRADGESPELLLWKDPLLLSLILCWLGILGLAVYID